MRFTAAVTKDGEWFVAQCLEVEVCSQGESREEALRNLGEALELHFEDEEPREIPEASIEYLDVAVGS